MTWNNRRKCKTPEDAIAALADGAKIEAYAIVRSSADSASYLHGQMAEFAAHWNIPFDSRALYEVAQEQLKENDDDQDDDGQHGWYASLC